MHESYFTKLATVCFCGKIQKQLQTTLTHQSVKYSFSSNRKVLTAAAVIAFDFAFFTNYTALLNYMET
jgi:hypothetical protein